MNDDGTQLWLHRRRRLARMRACGKQKLRRVVRQARVKIFHFIVGVGVWGLRPPQELGAARGAATRVEWRCGRGEQRRRPGRPSSREVGGHRRRSAAWEAAWPAEADAGPGEATEGAASRSSTDLEGGGDPSWLEPSSSRGDAPPPAARGSAEAAAAGRSRPSLADGHGPTTMDLRRGFGRGSSGGGIAGDESGTSKLSSSALVAASTPVVAATQQWLSEPANGRLIGRSC